MPAEDEGPKEGAEEDANDEVAIVIHRKQHDDVRNGELRHVQKGADELLEDVGSEGLRLEQRRRRLGGRSLVRIVRGSIETRSGCRGRRGVLYVGADDVRIELARGAAQSFKTHDEQEHADAGSCEHAFARDVPALGDETSVDRVPIPQHL